MDKPPTAPATATLSPATLARAPHRLLFFIGAANVLLAMFWWTLWLVEARWHVLDLPQPDVYGGWLHAIVMQYHVLAPFMFGFLLTVFPRWMGQDDLTVWHYVPVGLGLFGGQLLTLGGALGPAHLLHLGAVFTLVGWGTGLLYLLRMLWRDGGKTWHAVS
ncbi:MAG TPA: NnrS family protein, partial [Luteimonas sp.]